MPVAVGALLAWGTHGETFLLSDVQDGSGVQSTNTVPLGALAYGHVSAGAQPGGIAAAAGGGWVNSAGFLQTVDIKRPLLDSDGDGVPDELSRDNDSDGLLDLAEISGSAFGGCATTAPNAADTDGDGMNDAMEAVGMYDPNDPSHCLRIVGLTMADGELTITWIGKGGGTTNTVMASADLQPGTFTNEVSRTAYSGGVSPWYKTTNSWTGVPVDSRTFYQVRTSL